MGIRPKADGETIVLTDTHRDLVDDVTATTDEFGTVLGEGINEISATAKSANDSAGELASRVKALEDRQVVAKDSEGRIQAADPAAPGDVATKRYVDQVVENLPAPTAPPSPTTRAVFTGTGDTAASGWSTWQARSESDYVSLTELNTRITFTDPGLYLVTYTGPMSEITRNILTSQGSRSSLEFAAGSATETFTVSGADLKLRVVGSQPDLVIIVDRLGE